jgi:Uma2 family endonuclease
MTVVRGEAVDEHTLYPVHEEDSVPENPDHEYQTRYLRDALSARLPQHWVTGEICMYWERDARERYVAPDVLVVEGTREQNPHPVYLAWSDSPALLVIEVGSVSTFRKDEGPKVDRYLRDLGVREYLYCHALRERLRMWRLEGGSPVEVMTNEQGRVVSRELDLEFGLDADRFLRIYERDGRALLTHEEEHHRAEQEHRRAEQERARAEQERQRALALEREVERLREELRWQQGPNPAAGE